MWKSSRVFLFPSMLFWCFKFCAFRRVEFKRLKDILLTNHIERHFPNIKSKLQCDWIQFKVRLAQIFVCIFRIHCFGKKYCTQMANTGGGDHGDLWEYDAPQFVDFSKPLEENAEVEKWFGMQFISQCVGVSVYFFCFSVPPLHSPDS